MLTNGENGMKLAQPLSQKILPNELKLFQSSIMEDGILTQLCTTVRVCF